MTEQTEIPQEFDTAPDYGMMNEAPASINFYFVDKDGFNYQMTLRDGDELHLMKRVGLMKAWLTQHNCTPKAVGQQPAQASAPAPQPAASTPAPTTSAPPPPPPGNGGSQPQANVLNAVKMEVAPKPDGKAEVKFYAAGHQYADLYTTKAVGQIVDMLRETGNWQPEHFTTTAQTYQVNMNIWWKNSEKLNSRGNPYKDIVSIKPA
jgi:hypothetical protein